MNAASPSCARLQARTYSRTCRSDPLKPCSATRRSYTRLAVWRCLRGADLSCSSHASMMGATGPITGRGLASRSLYLRGLGDSPAIASRTTRRPCPCSRAIARTLLRSR